MSVVKFVKREDKDRSTMQFSSCRIPKRLENTSFDNVPDKEVLIDKLINGPEGQGLYIFGPTESGKTYASCAILKEMISGYYKKIEGKEALNTIYGLYFSIPELLSYIRENLNQEGEFSIINGCINTDILILDDFGAEKVSEWTTDVLYRIINGRYNNCKPIIVCSNLTPKELNKVVGDRIGRRLWSTCIAQEIS